MLVQSGIEKAIEEEIRATADYTRLSFLTVLSLIGEVEHDVLAPLTKALVEKKARTAATKYYEGRNPTPHDWGAKYQATADDLTGIARRLGILA